MATPQPQPGAQPKIVQTLLKRTLVALIIGGAVFIGLRWVQSKKGDYDNGGISVGFISAVRLEKDGQQVVLIKPDGTVVGTSSWKPGVTDREPVWSPDGKFLFFCSDRKDQTFNVFRWNPQSEDAQSRTVKGGGSRSNPTFAPGRNEDGPLVIAQGVVRQLDPATGDARQILPPLSAEISQSGSGDETGTDTSFSTYGNLGKSFRIARYLPDRSAIIGILRRDEGEALIVQTMTASEGGKLPRPKAIAAGDHIDFDIDPTSGAIVFSVQNFRWADSASVPEQFRKGGRLTVPYQNMVGMADPTKGQLTLIAASPDGRAGFGSPRIKPDSSSLLLVQGRMEDGALRPEALLALPLREAGIQQASTLVKGEVYGPAWSTDGKRIAYIKRTAGRGDLITVGDDGSDERNVTGGKGDFSSPLFSPMQTGK